jgi:hypothetical protein
MHTEVIPDVKKATLRGIVNQTVEEVRLYRPTN